MSLMDEGLASPRPIQPAAVEKSAKVPSDNRDSQDNREKKKKKNV